MQELLSKITGFPNTHFGHQDIIEEFNHKFGGTFLFVNNELRKVHSAANTQIKDNKDYTLHVFSPTETTTSEKKSSQIKSLKTFRPVCGFYWVGENNVALFRKTAKKQYQKSLSHNNYEMTVREVSNPKNMQTPLMMTAWGEVLHALVEDHTSPNGYISQDRQTLIANGYIYFRTQLIGEVDFFQKAFISFDLNSAFAEETIQLIQKELVL